MTGRRIRIAFMGTPPFAVLALDALHAAGHDIACVYAQPPRPAGRGQKVQPSAVQRRAEELGIPVRTPRSLRKDPAAQADFAALGLDAAVVAAYGLLLPQSVLDAPRHGCLNIHASLLPRWRGAAPIQRAILAGDAESGVCIMQMEAGLDTGPVLMRRAAPIGSATTAPELHDTLAEIGADLIVKTLAAIATGNPPAPQIQPEEGITYAHMLTKDEGRVDWTRDAGHIGRQLRALSPWPGVWCLHGGKRLKILEAEAIEGAGAPGEILHRDLRVSCGAGALRLKTVQPEGRRAMDGPSFVNGFHLNVGDRLT